MLKEVNGNNDQLENKISMDKNSGVMSVALDQPNFGFDLFVEVHDVEGGVISTSKTFTVDLYEDYCTTARHCKSLTREYFMCDQCSASRDPCDSKLCCDHEDQITSKPISYKGYQIGVN